MYTIDCKTSLQLVLIMSGWLACHEFVMHARICNHKAVPIDPEKALTRLRSVALAPGSHGMVNMLFGQALVSSMSSRTINCSHLAGPQQDQISKHLCCGMICPCMLQANPVCLSNAVDGPAACLLKACPNREQFYSSFFCSA